MVPIAWVSGVGLGFTLDALMCGSPYRFPRNPTSPGQLRIVDIRARGR